MTIFIMPDAILVPIGRPRAFAWRCVVLLVGAMKMPSDQMIATAHLRSFRLMWNEASTCGHVRSAHSSARSLASSVSVQKADSASAFPVQGS